MSPLHGAPAPHSRQADTITINSLSIHLPNGLSPSAFSLSTPLSCPISITMTIHLNPSVVPSCVGADTMSGLGVNYSSVSKEVYGLLSNSAKRWKGPEEIMDVTSRVPLALGPGTVESVDVRVEMPRALLQAESVMYSGSFANDRLMTGRECMIHKLSLSCVVGLHPHEQSKRQRLEVDVGVSGVEWRKWSHVTFADEVYTYIDASSSGTIEALVDNLASHLLSTSSHLSSPAATISISLRKPSALPFAIPSISITRTHADYSSRRPCQKEGKRIFVALGSNIGDRVRNIAKAVKSLKEQGVSLERGSRLYESEPMYVEDQDRFINGVIEVVTSLPALDLLKVLKRVERSVGRTKTFTNGPRVVDLDLLFYGHERGLVGRKGSEGGEDGVGWLEIPHPRIGEREFVVRPLAESVNLNLLGVSLMLASIAMSFRHPAFGSVADAFARFQSRPSSLAPIIAFGDPAKPLRLDGRTKVMQIFNATPDSFSDGSPERTNTSSALSIVRAMISDTAHPPDILDVGGMSTRPNAIPCSEEEELSRVLPLIQAIRSSSDERMRTIPISIDTYRPSVAERAVRAGASMINDVRGAREPGMAATMASLDVPVVLMHSRGDSTSMLTPDLQDYSAHGGVVQGVIAELSDSVRQCMNAGVKRWNILVDPGLGFAKSQADNLTLLRHLDEVVAEGSALHGFPLLVGGSRKGFVGKVIGEPRAELRGYGDAAVTAWCAQKGVEVVRVHDARGMGEVLRMSEGIWEGKAE